MTPPRVIAFTIAVLAVAGTASFLVLRKTEDVRRPIAAASSSTPSRAVAPSVVERQQEARPLSSVVLKARGDAREMIEGSLALLAERQNQDGSFGKNESLHVRVAVSAISCLALLSHGNTEHRGRYHDKVSRAIKFLMRCSIFVGPRAGYFTTNGDTLSRMHGHGYATLALTQAYGMFGVRRRYAGTTDELKRVINRAVAVIVKSQSRDGGWWYDPGKNIDSDEGSMTICMLQALRGARNCGFAVDDDVIRKAQEYIRACQNANGSFRYQKRGQGTVSFELTAAACATMINAGRYYDKSIRLARDWLWNLKFDEFIAGSPNSYPYYGAFYALQVLWFDYDDVRRTRFERYYPRLVTWFRRHYQPTTRTFQHASAQSNLEVRYGETYRAAFAALALQIPDGYLPIFQR